MEWVVSKWRGGGRGVCVCGGYTVEGEKWQRGGGGGGRA